MPRSVVYTAVPVYLLTAAAWAIGISNHRFLWSEFWLYALIFLVPAGLVCVSSWLLFMQRTWARVLGIVMVLPSAAIWLLSLLLVSNGFRIH